jgi:hypothetical protein
MKPLGFAGIIFFLLVFAPVVAYGCSCSPPTQIEEFKKAQSVIIGRFIETTGKGSKFRIVKSWKGAKANKIIFLNILILDCGLEIELVKGNEFLLYVPTQKGKPLYENKNPTLWFVCGRSNSAGRAQEDIKNMDKIAEESKKR